MLSSGSSYALAVRNRYAQHFKNIRILNLHDTSTHCGLAGTFFCESCSSLNLWRTCAHTGCRGLGPEPHKSNVMDASQVNVLDIAAAAYVNGLVGGDETVSDVRERLDAYDRDWALSLPMQCLDSVRGELLYQLVARTEATLVPNWRPHESLRDELAFALNSTLCSVNTSELLGAPQWANLRAALRGVQGG
mmetsp:Transcript_17594/g.56240  ORF Transcript_17594/g.56240 Transcript_17594/m.56240 type:complete len:191 (+) Transcript_17594:130-702(+)